MKKIVMVIMLFLLFGIDKAKGSIIVEFSEVTLTSPTLLDGTTYFDDYGLFFEDTTVWGTDERFIGAGIDDVGIATTGYSDKIMTVVFEEGAMTAMADWLTITTSVISATAFDSWGTVLDFKSGSGIEDFNHGSFIFSDIGTISKITFEGTEHIGVGRLEFVPVPEPGTLILLGFGVIVSRMC